MWEPVFSVAALLVLGWLLLFGLLEAARRWGKRKPNAETNAFWLWAVLYAGVLLLVTMDPAPSVSMNANAGPALTRILP